MGKVRMVQTMQHRWKIETEKGVVMQEDIILQNPTQAQGYVTNYISSFSGWTAEVVPLKKEKKNEQI
jgi:hypothetical protein